MSPRDRSGPVKAAPPGGSAGLDRPCLFGPRAQVDRIVAGGWHNVLVSKSAIERETKTSQVSTDMTEEELVARIAADREAGRDTTKDVEALLRLAGEKNRAALDRLAK